MEHSERFDISFGTIEFGWLPVCIVIDEERFDLGASRVENDPIFEFADTAEALAGDGAARSEVLLWLEPDRIYLLFACAPASSVVRLSVRASDLNDDTTVPITEVVLNRRAVADSLVSALRVLQGQFSGNEPLRGWGRFPTPMLHAALARIGAPVPEGTD